MRLTGAVGVHHETAVDMVLDEQKRLFKYLPGPGLLHSVWITWISEKSQQLSWSTRLAEQRTSGSRVRGGAKQRVNKKVFL